jgi:hypothetical protein
MGVLLQFSTTSIIDSVRASLATILSEFFPSAAPAEEGAIIAAALQLPISLPAQALLLQASGDRQALSSLIIRHCTHLLRTNGAVVIQNR